MANGTGFDVAVIGGGPAGTAAAITAARRGAKVLLLESGSYPRHKVCGEFVSPEALASLKVLLDSEIFNRLTESSGSIHRVSIRTRCFSTALLRFDPAALSISRHTLDFELWKQAIAAGAVCHERCPAASVHAAAGGRIVVSRRGEFHAAHIIIAAGRWSNLQRRLPPPKGKSWLGLKGHFRGALPEGECQLYFFHGGYCGVQPAGAGTINVAAMVRSDFASSLIGVFAMDDELCRRASDWQPLFPPISCAPLFHDEPSSLHDGMLLAGDASGFVDPFVGDGIALALHDGQMAAEAILENPQGAAEHYSERYRSEVVPVFRNAARLRTLLHAGPVVQRMALLALRSEMVQRTFISSTRVAGKSRIR